MMKPRVQLYIPQNPLEFVCKSVPEVQGFYLLKNKNGKEFRGHVLIREPIRLEVVNGMVECESANTIYELHQSEIKNIKPHGKRYLPPLDQIEIVRGIVHLIRGIETQTQMPVSGILIEDSKEYYKVDAYGLARTGIIYFLK
jgi:hypothetical protein